MTSTATVAVEAPLLRTLSPALRGLERGLRGWLDGPRRFPLSTIARAAFEGMAADLRGRPTPSTWTDAMSHSAPERYGWK